MTLISRHPLASYLLDPGRLAIARRLGLGFTPATGRRSGASAGIRRALHTVHTDPRSALAWIIGRYGDPLPRAADRLPRRWHPGYYRDSVVNMPSTISGVSPQLRAAAAAYGYGSGARGVAFAIDYLALRDEMPRPEFEGGESLAPPRFSLYTLDQHLEQYRTIYAAELAGLQAAFAARAQLRAARQGRAELPATPASEPTEQQQPTSDTDWMDK